MKTKASFGWLKSTTFLFAGLFLVFATSCSKKSDDAKPAAVAKYGFQISAGGQSVEIGKTFRLGITTIDANGNEIAAPAGITYTVSPDSLGTVTNGVFKGNKAGTGTVTAKMSFDGYEYTSVIPIVTTNAAELFHVVPQAIVWTTGAGNIQLETVYFGTQAPGAISYSVESGNSASVNNTGQVSFNNSGQTVIKVSTTIGGQAVTVKVPVLVVGLPAAPLPVARVKCAPNPVLLFRGETQTLTPEAFNSENVKVNNETFTYEVINKDTGDGQTGPIVTVSATGVVSPVRVGNATIIVTCKGISTQVEAEVLPDKVILNDKFFASLGQDIFNPLNPPVTEVTVNASTYTINKAAYRSKDYNNMLNLVANPSGLDWEVPTFPQDPIFNEFFDLLSLSNKTNTSVLVKPKSSTAFGTTFLISYDRQDLEWTEPGVTAFTVLP
jgi:hypothetical protein